MDRSVIIKGVMKKSVVVLVRGMVVSVVKKFMLVIMIMRLCRICRFGWCVFKRFSLFLRCRNISVNIKLIIECMNIIWCSG